MTSLLPQFENVVAWSIQVSSVALAALVVSALLRVTHPAARYAFWRAVLVLCLLLPWVPALPPLTSNGTATVLESVVAPSDGIADGVSESPVDWRGVVFAIVAAGVSVRLVWLAIGYARLRRLRSAGASARDEEFADVQATLATRAEIRYKFFSIVDRTQLNFSPSIELIDNSTGKTAAIWLTIGFFEVTPPGKPQ